MVGYTAIEPRDSTAQREFTVLIIYAHNQNDGGGFFVFPAHRVRWLGERGRHIGTHGRARRAGQPSPTIKYP
jgi:hypothetical protein